MCCPSIVSIASRSRSSTPSNRRENRLAVTRVLSVAFMHDSGGRGRPCGPYNQGVSIAKRPFTKQRRQFACQITGNAWPGPPWVCMNEVLIVRAEIEALFRHLPARTRFGQSSQRVGDL